MQEALLYSFSLERHVPCDHMLRKIDRFIDLSGVRALLVALTTATWVALTPMRLALPSVVH
jgi:hypothetical protein